jgi:Tol biopolymer transport system component
MRGLTLLIAIAIFAAASAGSTSTGPTGRIAYAPRFLPTDNWEIFTVNAAGGRTVNLTRNPRCHETSPAWSHDGRWIAFMCAGRLVVMRDDRRARRTVVRLRGQFLLGDPAWSPDDRQLAFPGSTASGSSTSTGRVCVA